MRFIVSVGPDVLAALAHDDPSPGILASGEDHARGNVGVLEQLEGHEAVVRGCFWVVENVAQLLQVGRTQQVRDVGHRS